MHDTMGELSARDHHAHHHFAVFPLNYCLEIKSYESVEKLRVLRVTFNYDLYNSGLSEGMTDFLC